MALRFIEVRNFRIRLIVVRNFQPILRRNGLTAVTHCILNNKNIGTNSE